jgi:riboflavin synthase alpha subunit
MLAEPNKGDSIKVNGITYTVDEYESDGVGVLTIFLVRRGKRLN